MESDNDNLEVLKSLSFRDLKKAHELANMTVSLEGNSYVTASGRILYTAEYFEYRNSKNGWFIVAHFPMNSMGCTEQLCGAVEGYENREKALDAIREAFEKDPRWRVV